ncbi:hypothetical protein B0A50_01955 [Salinomyces thailandicus]|uniref:AB hydrolase-1 domain-containing protein n=1 Tax=Salinomyces thailandicus TaxID=706561 RepID=A0A4U0U7I5_9PEZI|nr:hypothetical protein B0A50_01955 [Salinomyces thailandica]
MSTQQTAPTTYISTAPGVTTAYRLLQPSSPTTKIPLLLHIHFRANMDFWDPAFINPLAQHRPLLLFDQPGTGRSTGTVATTFAGWASSAAALLTALEIEKCDVLGFSMGGCCVQMLALGWPGLVRKLILAGTGASAPPEGFEGRGSGLVWPRDVPPRWAIAGLASARGRVQMEEAIRWSFFPGNEEGASAARRYWGRVYERKGVAAGKEEEEGLWELLGDEGSARQREAYAEWMRPNPGNSFERLGELKMPVLVVNGVEDLLIPTSRSWELVKGIRDAGLIVYRGAGHGFLWQYPKEVAGDVGRFLDGGSGGMKARM